jgi:hypothetical protein
MTREQAFRDVVKEQNKIMSKSLQLFSDRGPGAKENIKPLLRQLSALNVFLDKLSD